MVQGRELSAAVARVRAQTARYAMLDDEHEEAIRVGREALEMAERLGLGELRANVLTTIGTAMSNAELGAGDELLREAIDLGAALNSVERPRALNNLAISAWHRGSIFREHELLLESRAAAERVGSDNFVRFAEGNLCWTFYAIGGWDESLRRSDTFIAECEAGSPHGLEGIAQYTRAEILLGRSDLDGAIRASSRTMELSVGGSGPMDERCHLLAARVAQELGHLDEARAAVMTAFTMFDRIYSHDTISLVLLAKPLGLTVRVDELLERAHLGPWLEIARLVVAGELTEAARRLDETGYLALAAQVRLGSHADAELDAAINFFDSVGATRYLARAEAQLAAMA